MFLMSGIIMSKQPLGKTLLRNVIRHTDAHNKVRLDSTSVCKMKVEGFFMCTNLLINYLKLKVELS